MNNKKNMPKRVLHFTIANACGGITKYILRLWKYVDRDRFHFDFVTMSEKLDFAEQLEAEGCKIYYLSTYAEDDKEQFIKEVKNILNHGYDIVHLHTNWWRGFVLEKLAKEAGVPKIIVHSHNTDVHIKENQSREEARQLHLEQRALLTEDMATDFLACSPEASEWLFADRISKDKIKIVPCAVEIKDYLFNDKTRNEYREGLGIKEVDYVIGHVGRFAYQKNHEFLIDVFKEVAERLPHAILLLIGKGELEQEIRNKVVRYNLEGRVRFLGIREDIGCLMQVMDLFAFPSRFEGNPIVLTEAQAAGLQCVVSEKITPTANITDKVDFLPLELQEWVDKILRYNEGYERKNMEDVMKNAGYGMDALIKQIEEIYEGDCLRIE